MSFSSPGWLLALLVVPLLIVVHALSIRWRSTPASSLVFWNEVLRERKASLRIRRLLTSLVLLLQCLAMTGLAFALAGPLVRGRGRAGAQDVVLVLDATASMQAREGARSRFDLARERGLSLAAGLRGGARMAVVLAERSPRLLSAFTTDKGALRRLLREATPTDEAGDVAAAALFGISLRDPRRGGQVVLETDGAFDDLAGVDTTLPWFRVDLVGTAQDNVGITQMSLRMASGPEPGYVLFLAVRSTARAPVDVPLTVSAAGRPVLSRVVRVPAGGRSVVTVPWTGPATGRVEARLPSRDPFPLDDRAYAVFAPARRVQVLVIGPQPYFLQRALSSLPGVTVRTQEVPGPVLPQDDVVVYDGVQPPALDPGNYILLGVAPPNLPLKVTGSLRVPTVTGWSRDDPLLDSVSLAGLAIGGALDLEPGPGFSILAASGTSPLVMSWDHPGLKALLLAFDPSASDFPLRPGFPILLANTLSWFFPAWLQAQADQTPAGEPRLLDAGGAARVTVTKPDGGREVIAASGPSATFFDADEAGFYRVEAGDSSSEFAANLDSDSETDITPRFSPPAGISPSTGSPGLPVPVWPLLAAAVLAFLLLEWWAWAWRPGNGKVLRA